MLDSVSDFNTLIDGIFIAPGPHSGFPPSFLGHPDGVRDANAIKPDRRRELRAIVPGGGMVLLLVGIIGAALSWTTLGKRARWDDFSPCRRRRRCADGLAAGVAYPSTGVLGFAFFWVVSLINRQLSDIRRLLLKKSDGC
jgi:hypothetical protein